MDGLSIFLQCALCIVLISVCTLSVQLATLAWVRVFRKSRTLKLASLSESELPRVLVQLPVC
ncbi:MAG: glycosyl transferase family 2, partial [Rubrivivax sp.]